MTNRISKTLAIALASMIGLSGLAATQAKADTRAGFSAQIIIGSGGVRDHRDHRDYRRDHRDTVRDHRGQHSGQVIIRDHRTPPRQNTVVAVPNMRLDCRTGKQKLRRMGYHNIRINDCSGHVYHYTAMDGAAIFRARMNARNGHMDVVFAGLAR